MKGARIRVRIDRRRRPNCEVSYNGVTVDDEAEAEGGFERLSENADTFGEALNCEIPGTTTCLRWNSSTVGHFERMSGRN